MGRTGDALRKRWMPREKEPVHTFPALTDSRLLMPPGLPSSPTAVRQSPPSSVHSSPEITEPSWSESTVEPPPPTSPDMEAMPSSNPSGGLLMVKGRGLQRSVGVSGRLAKPSSCWASSPPTLTLRLAVLPSLLLSSRSTSVVINSPERTMELVVCLQSDTGSAKGRVANPVNFG